MKHLFNINDNNEIIERLNSLNSGLKPLWGKMNVGQMTAHCAGSLEMSLGIIKPKRNILGIFIGRMVKNAVLSKDEIMRKNVPTSDELRITSEVDLENEKKRLIGLVEKFRDADPAICTDHPHPFFGKLSPDEWGRLMFSHLNHHLSQFGR